MEDVNRTPREAKDYYSSSIWLSESAQAFEDLKKSDINGIYFTAGKDSNGNNYQEIETPEISRTLTTEIEDYDLYSRQSLTTEIVEIIEDGSKSINNKERRVDDLYVAVGKDDVDVVKWTLDHAVSRGSRIFLIHVSSPITLIPTPVGKFERSQLTPHQVRLYVNKVNNKRKDLLQKYILMSREAKVVAETLLLESNDTGKAILDLTSILNITNLVMGIKKLPCTRRNNKLSKGLFVKKNAPKSCKVTLVYNGEVFVSNLDGLESCGLQSQSKSHCKANFFQCMCFSGCAREDNGN
ncbi:hypothetical protein Fmac_026153 [Flemingia macrophylla]|uniref:Uncharacterized protein n=1 Tax=Flemingia macrophylla TaxID=520843 RepID=A0ABD1LE20_9FABA